MVVCESIRERNYRLIKKELFIWAYPTRQAALTISSEFSSTPCTASVPYFSAFSFSFYSISAIQVPLQRQQQATAVITVAIFELSLLGRIARSNKSNNMIRRI